MVENDWRVGCELFATGAFLAMTDRSKPDIMKFRGTV